ncbi:MULTISPECIES: hypothetical protein [unclassified Gilliamella]|uniref:phage tail assembly chaperone n=1 Tax=unclassified Gilliamella TaxID=2685620 RepID=UPI00226A7EF6|nr:MULTISPECIES: hypothetical protein [unclassified Gilliamella]MCX8588563.1 hypothetical protein [Gilliamella sp. B3801]MCX8593001.1 hypothetical protein [Gilliamella sp. B3804]
MNGKDEDIIRMSQQMGQAIPDKIKNKPELDEHLEFYYQAFLDLDTTRSHSMGPTPISWLAIIEYARFYQLDNEDTNDFVYLIREMDKVNLKHVNRAFKSKN